MQKIVLTGGGTAGHIMPNLALIPHLTNFELHYVGCPNSMEERLIKTHAPHVTFHAISSVKLVRGKILKNLSIPFKLCASKRRAKALLQEIKPSVIFSKGGYVALPVTLAAKKIPVILHESDFSFGLANKIALKKCTHVLTSFSDLAYTTPQGIHTGAAIRADIYKGEKMRAETYTGLKERTNLLITGGSLGAQGINHAVFACLNQLTAQFNVVHITGKNNTQIIKDKPNYFQIPFTDKIADLFAWSDFCITRGGANALFELIALKIPSLVIPLPKGVSRGDQVDNAEYFKRLNCVHVLEQHALTENPHLLMQALERLINEKSNLKSAMQSTQNIDGTAHIVKLIKACCKD